VNASGDLGKSRRHYTPPGIGEIKALGITYIWVLRTTGGDGENISLGDGTSHLGCDRCDKATKGDDED
jgi:hypothetical protein